MALSLDDLSRERAFLNEAVRRHRASVSLWPRGAPAEQATGPKPLVGVTTTITCQESLASSLAPEDAAAGSSAMLEFARHALEHPDLWTSDGGGYVYCRVRGLGGLLRSIPEPAKSLPERSGVVVTLLEQAWRPDGRIAGSFGLNEFVPSREGADASPGIAHFTDGVYPANAYLTYWGLLALEHLPADWRPGWYTAARTAAIDWLEKALALQVTYHYHRSAYADPQQLAWAICGVVRYSNPAQVGRFASPLHDLLTAGLRAFFKQQHPVRFDWDRGQQLFHFPTAGNAYSFVYETLGELIGLASDPALSTSAALRVALKPYETNLIASAHAVWQAAAAVAQGDGLEWSSGHHPNRDLREPWATASVFRFLQELRRLVAHWTRDSAMALLRARKPQGDLKDLRDRGGTWYLNGSAPAGTQLSMYFVHPINKFANEAPSPRSDDPDVPALPDEVSRGAMLFGPPGTGKTTLAEAVAGALGWDFVEVTPALFLDAGVEMVSSRADSIFRAMMELDHCVILLDEIDELVRDRDAAAEPIERFFTTTMLPRLAGLWKSRRVVFFANTNGIADVDPAIRRSQRFDAAILVMPPGPKVKQKQIAEALQLDVEIDAVAISQTIAKSKGASDDERGYAALALLRYDQIPAFCVSYRRLDAGGWTQAAVAAAIRPFAKELAQSDWGDRLFDDEKIDFTVVEQQARFERRDPSRARLLVDATDPTNYIEVLPGVEDLHAWAESQGLEIEPSGEVRHLADGAVEPGDADAPPGGGDLRQGGVLTEPSGGPDQA